MINCTVTHRPVTRGLVTTRGRGGVTKASAVGYGEYLPVPDLGRHPGLVLSTSVATSSKTLLATSWATSSTPLAWTPPGRSSPSTWWAPAWRSKGCRRGWPGPAWRWASTRWPATWSPPATSSGARRCRGESRSASAPPTRWRSGSTGVDRSEITRGQEGGVVSKLKTIPMGNRLHLQQT